MTVTYKPDDNFDTPYMRAKQVWDDRMGNARVQAANWRLISFCLVGIIAILSFGLVYLGMQSKVIPYVVEINNSGDIKVRGRATEYAYKPSLALTKYFLMNFVQSVRSISSDPVINGQNWGDRPFAFLSKRSAEMLSTHFRDNDPRIEFKTKTRSVDIDTILPLSEKSYQVDWLEIEFDKNGNRTNVQNVRGVFTVLNRTPSSEEQIIKNPLGIYIDHFSWSIR